MQIIPPGFLWRAVGLTDSLLFSCQTRVQASTLSFPEVIAKLPEIGARGVYRGSIPAILGQFSRSFQLSQIKDIITFTC